MNKKWTCEDCGKEVDYILIHGYDYGDRQLEGIYFEARCIDGDWAVKIRDKDKDYFEQFNSQFWYDIITSALSNGDIDLATCPECEGDIVVNETITQNLYSKSTDPPYVTLMG